MSLVLNVEILGEYKNLAKATQGAQNTLSKLGDSFKVVAGRIGTIIGGIGIGLGAAVVSQIRPAVTAASDLEESINAVNVSFGEAAQGVLDLGKNSAKGLGLSKSALYGIATQFSNFAETIAGDGGDVVKVIEDLANRGADFASVYNLEVGDALNKFQSGLAGETEPLRRFGVDLSATAVEAHALAMEIWDGEGAMTESEKVMARYSLLMEDTAKVAGDFGNTSEGVANQQRILTAEIEDSRAEIGEKFLPILADLQKFIIEKVLPAITDFWEYITNPENEPAAQLKALEAAFEQFVAVWNGGSSEIQRNDVFKWIGDSAVSAMKGLTVFSVLATEIMDGMAKIFSAGFGMGPAQLALRNEGIRQVLGASGAAIAAGDAIRFADEFPTSSGGSGEDDRFLNIELNINRATIDPNQLINDINTTLRNNGSNIQLR
jgi:hypothetical protein